MANNTRPFHFLDYLPQVFQASAADGAGLLGKFLKPFEAMFEDLESLIEGVPGGALKLVVTPAPASIVELVSVNEKKPRPDEAGKLLENKSDDSTADAVDPVPGFAIKVDPFSVGDIGFSAGSIVTNVGKNTRTLLSIEIAAGSTDLTEIRVADDAFIADAGGNDVLKVHPGGLPDLFNPDTTPPPQVAHSSDSEFDFLTYLASWIALPLRVELVQLAEMQWAYEARRTLWNREFFKAAMLARPRRGTAQAMNAILREWMKGELIETNPPLMLVSDLTRARTDVNTVFQLAPASPESFFPGEVYAQLGLNSVLGEGPPFFFVADLIANPKMKELRSPGGIDVLQRAARFILDNEKPAHTYYQLRVRGRTMQLAPAQGSEVIGEIYAQLGETSLMWNEPLVINSEM